MQKNSAEDLLFEKISKRWPNAVKYITRGGIISAFNQDAQRNRFETLDQWEFEASECERVLRAIDYKQGPVQCPKCDGRQFQTNIFTIVNFAVPFVHSHRVTVQGFQGGSMLQKTDVKCLKCGELFKQKEAVVYS